MFISIPEAIEIIRRGEILILVDDEDRENEGDFICAAEKVTPEIVNFMATHGRGLICATLTLDRMKDLDLLPMVHENTSLLGTNFTVTVDAVKGTTTGISTADRALTVRTLADPKACPEDLGRPGHISPIGAVAGGVLRRAGHTEGTCDLARLAGLQPVGMLCEVLNADGTMARRPDLEVIAVEHNLKIATIQDLIAYRVEHERLVEKGAETVLPNEFGEWRLCVYENKINGDCHTALIFGEPEKQESALVRVHSQCFTGDTLGSFRCDCGPQLHTAMARIAEEGHGVLLYMAQEGRGIGLLNKIKAYALQDKGRDTVEANEELGFRADLRDYGIGAQILRDLGLCSLRLMTNNPRKIVGLEAYGLHVVDRVPIEVGAHARNKRYLGTKKEKLGHMLGEKQEK
ncbi:TPA: bifunctional 3,4-dihydroxy-2-butanone-4-phosphate synthase/GTP cyclohydrolase II [Candidatus Sumerlaeota bacterium]|jgi:3,4-dihydroxy 2-butanone 4-phosphate synthase / GTP cyclohydrolase II|nr:bifunctional 3,4-dihydroxy-2-butanone-4-phosphate synthase/GTP cyclohydrolase II [Candidatus Sumerlaeota bacterium]